jgi:ketosteroid isomerase-like protein
MRMNRRMLACASVILLGAGLLAPAASAQSQPDASGVEQSVEEFRKLMINPDQQKLDAIFADQLTYGHSDGRVQTKQEIIDGLINHRSVFHSITLSNQTVMVSGDVAVIRHRFEADAVSNGKPTRPDIRVLQVWQKQVDRWRLLVRQAH